MFIPKYIKVPLYLSGLMLFCLALAITSHNLRTVISGQDEKFFYFIFIVVFFLTPPALLYLTGVFIFASLRRARLRRRMEPKEEDDITDIKF